MTNIKNYTDLKQSKKLVEFLPLESADMYYILMPDGVYNSFPLTGRKNELTEDTDIPCWSLAALLGVLPDNCGIDKEDGKYIASYIVSGECGTYTSDNPVDACVSMIEYLHKLKLL